MLLVTAEWDILGFSNDMVTGRGHGHTYRRKLFITHRVVRLGLYALLLKQQQLHLLILPATQDGASYSRHQDEPYWLCSQEF